MKLNEPTAVEKRAHAVRVDRAVTLMSYYFELVAKRAGIKWNSDNDAEVRELVELLIGELK